MTGFDIRPLIPAHVSEAEREEILMMHAAIVSLEPVVRMLADRATTAKGRARFVYEVKAATLKRTLDSLWAEIEAIIETRRAA